MRLETVNQTTGICLHKAVLPAGLASTSVGGFLKLGFVFLRWCSKPRAFMGRVYKMFQKKVEMSAFLGILQAKLRWNLKTFLPP